MSPAEACSSELSTVNVQSRRMGVWPTTASIVAADVISLSVVYWVAVLARYYLSPSYSLEFYLHLYPGILLFLLAFLVQGLYPGVLIHPVEEIRRVSHGVTTAFLLAGAATFVGGDGTAYSRSVFLMTWAAGIPAALLLRTLVKSVFKTREWWGVPAVVIGSHDAARGVAEGIVRNSLGLRVVGILTDCEPDVHADSASAVPLLGRMESAPQFAAAGVAKYAIIAVPDLSPAELRAVIQNSCRGFRHILIIPELPYVCSLGVSARDVGGELGIEVPQRLFHRSAGLIKRALDVVFSMLGIFILAPVFGVICLLVKMSSKGPVFYRHSRHGLNGNIFGALKFRTMYTDGDLVLRQFLQSNPDRLDYWQREHKLPIDPRVTAIGRWLRTYSLDELPQLLDVLAGSMSLVGPRPIPLNEVGKYGSSFAFCTSVRPGMTGLWQVSGRNDLPFEDRVRLNEYYIRNWSIWLDLYILCRTINVVIRGQGAY